MNELMIVLSGESSTIPEAEAVSLLRAYDKNFSLRKLCERVLVARTSAPLLSISRRIAYSRVLGMLVEKEEIKERVRGKRIRWSYFSFERKEHKPGIDISSLDSKVDLENPELEIVSVFIDREYFLLSIPEFSKKLWVRRRPRARPYFHPSALYPKLARAMVNRTELTEGKIIVDPFAGTGSIPIEAHICGLIPVAIDISQRAVAGCRKNMLYFNQRWEIIRADSRLMPLHSFDGIATDVPYGRVSSTYSSKPEQILEDFLSYCYGIAGQGKKIVVMHPSDVKISSSFYVEQEHYIPIHRSLTRKITVMRK